MTHHSPLTVLANIPAPSCGIGSTSTRRELRTSSENAPRCVDENADTANVKSPSVPRTVSVSKVSNRNKRQTTHVADQPKIEQNRTCMRQTWR